LDIEAMAIFKVNGNGSDRFSHNRYQSKVIDIAMQR